MAKREYDLVVFGATGFTGREVCFHLAELRSLRAPVRWSVAGRCRAKLLTLCEEIERLRLDAHHARAPGRVRVRERSVRRRREEMIVRS